MTPDQANPETSDEELKRLGITRVPADHFLWGEFRYSHARDAISAAKRGAAK